MHNSEMENEVDREFTPIEQEFLRQAREIGTSAWPLSDMGFALSCFNECYRREREKITQRCSAEVRAISIKMERVK